MARDLVSFNQGEFDFSAVPGESGYRRWRERLDESKRKFEQRWGVIIGRPVRIRLDGHARSIEGTIRLLSPTDMADAKSIRLRINSLEFTPAMIESITRLDD